VALVLFTLAGFAVWAAVTTRRASNEVKVSIVDTRLYDEARHLVVDEGFWVTEALLLFGPQAEKLDKGLPRKRYAAAAAGSVGTLQQIVRVDRDRDDVTPVRRLLVLQRKYSALAGLLFDAVDKRDARRATHIEIDQIDPIAGQLERGITAAAREHERRATDALASLERTERTAFRATLLIFGGGLLLLVGFGVLLEVARRSNVQRQIELAQLDAEKRALDSQNEQLRELDRMKDDFVASVSHELRTPLTSIRGYLELVLEGEAGDVTEEQKQFLGIVERNADRLLRVVGDLLFVAQVGAGTLHLERSTVDVDGLAEQALSAARPAADAKQIALNLTADDLPELVGDPARIGQMLDNLVSNAIKFTPPGGRVDIRAFPRDGYAVIEVADSGMGIPAAEQERLFERFFRTRAASEQAIQGTGLGLAISKAVAEAHGGTIAFESREGVGTTFRVELPLERQEVRA
jgi:signal transduction histidine kinase